MTETNWTDAAACRGLPPSMFILDTRKPRNAAAVAKGLAVCATCTVRTECLEAGLALDEPGIWSGTTDDQRHGIPRPAGGIEHYGCGTNAGYHRHHRDGERACQRCLLAHAQYRAMRERERLAVGA
jgi:WhiB family redox-sensing transcriptional regulator